MASAPFNVTVTVGPLWVRPVRWVQRLGWALLVVAIAPSHAAPAPWYYWRSTYDGARVCAQASPGFGWARDSAAYEGPGCQLRRKLLIIPVR